MKDESDTSDIIVYDMHDDYSVGRSSKSKKTTDKEEKKESPNPNQQYGDNDSTAHLGGLTGRVYDKLTYLTVRGALVTIAKDVSVKTDERGNFVVGNIKPGTYRVTVSEDGYIIQSRKSTVVAGETTQLESFHLIPACLAAEYPDAIVEEDEETGEEDIAGEETVGSTVEPAVVPPPLTSPEDITCAPATGIAAKREEAKAEEIAPEKLSEETTQVSSDVVIVKDAEGEMVPDSKIIETVIEENPLGYSEIDVGEETLAVPEETVEETSLEKIEEKTNHEELFKPPIEIAPKTLFQEKIAEEVQEKEPSLDVSVEEAIESPVVDGDMHAMTIDSIETAMTVPEETAAGDVCSVDELPRMSIETNIAEVTQPEEVLQEHSEEETRLKPSWTTWFKRKPKKEAHEEVALKPSIEAAPEVAIQEVAVEETHREEPPADAFVSDETVSIPADEIQISAITADSTETTISVAEKEMAIGEEPSIEERPSMSIETGIVEVTQSEEIPQEPSEEKAPIQATMEMKVQEEIEEGVRQEKLSELSIEVTSEDAPQAEVYEEKPSVDVSISEETLTILSEEIQTPAITVDSTEAAITVIEERIAKDVPTVDDLPGTYIETSIAEATQLEKVPEVALGETTEELSLEETPIETSAVAITEEKVQEEAYQESLLASSAGGITEQSVPLVEHEKPRLQPSTEVISKTTPLEMTQSEEVPAEVFQEPSEEEHLLKLQWWKLRKRKTKEAHQEQSPGPSAKQPVLLSEHEEAPLGPSRGFASKTTPQEMVAGEDRDEQQAVETSAEDISQELYGEKFQSKPPQSLLSRRKRKEVYQEQFPGHSEGEVTKQSVPFTEPEESPLAPSMEEAETTAAIEGGEEEACETITEEESVTLSDDAIASLSDEEREAMSGAHDTVEVEGFIGVINAQPNPAYKGLPISIAYTLRNVACDDPDNFIVRITVINPDLGTIHETFETPVKCQKGTFSIGGFVIFTTTYETCAYRLNMEIVSKKTETAHPLIGIPLGIKAIY